MFLTLVKFVITLLNAISNCHHDTFFSDLNFQELLVESDFVPLFIHGENHLEMMHQLC